MGRRKSAKPEGMEEARRPRCQHDLSRNARHSAHSADRDHRGSDDSGGHHKHERMPPAQSTKNLSQVPFKSGSSSQRSSRPPESPQGGYKGFHFPSGDQHPLGPLPQRGGMPPPNNNYPLNSSISLSSPTNGYVPNGYGGGANGYNPTTMNGSLESSPMHNANAGRAVGANAFSPSHVPPPPPQPNAYCAMPGGSPNNMNASWPPRQPPPQRGVDFGLMMQAFRNLPQLPCVMTPNGPLSPPPFPFPFPDLVQLQQLQQQQQMMMQMRMSPNGTPGNPASPLPLSLSGPASPPQQQPPPPPVAALGPFYGPPGTNVPGMAPNQNMSYLNGVCPVAAGAMPPSVPPFNGAAGPAATPEPLHRTTSILNRVSSFKKSAPAPSPDKAHDANGSGGSILNRASSFKRNARGGGPSFASSPSSAPSTEQQPTAQASPTAKPTGAAAAIPPAHSAAAAKPLPDSGSTGILRRKSFFSAAAAVPEPVLSPDEREAVLQMKLVQREHERVRLEEEHRAREEAMDKVIENRGKELREEGAARDASAEESATLPTCVMTSVEVSPPSNLLSPKADATREAADASYEKMSRASSYSFASIATTRSGAVGPQPALPHLSKQHPPGTHRRGASPVADAGEFSTKSDAPVESMASNRMGGVNRSAPTTTTTGATSAAAALAGESRPQQQSQTAPPSSQVVPPPRGSIIASAPAVLEPKQPWHRCPTVVVYEIPLRCRRTTNEEGREVIDDADFPVRIHSKTLRVTDPETKLVSEFPHDELVIHRKNSTNVASQLLDKVRDVVIAGYTASVLSLDSKGLAKPTSAFDSAAWMAKQRLVLNLVASVEKMQTIYAKNGGLSSNNSSIEVCVSIALVKKVSAEKATEWKVTDPAMQQRTFEVIDLLKPEPAVAQLRMRTSMLSGSRLDGVQYKPVGNEAEFNTLLTGAQSSANVVLGRLADAAAVAPDNAALMAENDSVLEVLTCIVRHHKEGAVALADQIKEAPRDVFARGNAADVISSDDEDDDARVLDSFNAHNGPSNCSDTVVSCLTCIGARQNADVWGAALERKEEVAPLALFTTAFGGPAYTVIIASVDPTSREAAATLSMQVGMTIKLHRRPTNGSARRLIQSSKYQAGAAQKELDRPVRPSGSEQRELKTTIRKSAATLESLEKALADGG